MLSERIKVMLILALLYICVGCSSKVYDLSANVKIENGYISEKECLRVNFSFILGQREKINFNGLVFLKFYNNMGKVEFMDVHRPPYKMSDWIPSTPINYLKCIEIPENIPEGEYKVSFGFIDPANKNKRIKIRHEELKNGEYYAGKFNVIKVIYYLGSYGVEKVQKSCEDSSFVWLTKEAKIYISNPYKKVILSFNIRAPISYFKGQPQKTNVYLNNKLIGTIIFDSNDIVEKRFKASPKDLGKREFFELKFDSEQEFIPAEVLNNGKDKRALAVQLYSIAFE